MQFAELRLNDSILRAVEAEGYSTATPIQAQAIPHVLAGRDVLGCAQTGTGKTAAFAMPILHRLAASKPGKHIRCLVLAPTRELAAQIHESFRTYGQDVRLRYAVIYGGVNQNPQVDALRRGVDVLIATPGRLIDLVNQRHVNLSGVETFVLDEADRMLDMGFIADIRRIAALLPTQRQTLLFSATMPGEIRSLAESLLKNPVSVQVAPVASTAEKVEQKVYFVDKQQKASLLAHLVEELAMFRAIVFTRTKRGADKVVRKLQSSGIKAEAIHSNKSQNARARAMKNFGASRTHVLVATDIASRGIDIDDISHVVNFDLTHEPETYVHRIGRTARAGASGMAISFVDREELSNLRAIEKLIRRRIDVAETPRGLAAAEPKSAAHPRGDHASREPARTASDRGHAPRTGHGDRPVAFRGHSHDTRPHAPARPHGPKPTHAGHGTAARRDAAPARAGHPLDAGRPQRGFGARNRHPVKGGRRPSFSR
jgi:ATP-dependent RNA helicase RhlE